MNNPSIDVVLQAWLAAEKVDFVGISIIIKGNGSLSKLL